MEKLEWLWPFQVAQRVGGISSQTVRRAADAGLIECHRDPKGRRRFHPEVVEILRSKMGLPKPADPATYHLKQARAILLAEIQPETKTTKERGNRGGRSSKRR